MRMAKENHKYRKKDDFFSLNNNEDVRVDDAPDR